MRRLLSSVTALALLAGLMGEGLTIGAALGAEPSSGTVKARPKGGATLNYKGTVPPGTGSIAGECEDGVNADFFTLTVTGTTKRFYRTHNVLLTARIDWDPRSPSVAINDLAYIIQRNGNTLDDSDGGEDNESVAVQNPKEGEYKLIACAFANSTPQPYLAKVFMTSTPKATERLPKKSKSRGLKFMPIVTVDPQRDVAEPSLRIDKAGHVYSCGPFGASRTSDYAWLSQDKGDTFRVLGEPPEGKIAPGGGGDCDLSVAPKKNSDGNYNLSYAGLEALTNFSTGLSTDNGRTFTSTNTSETIPVVDRQWLESHGQSEVYLFYNQIPQGGTLQRSTDGGLTYAPASPGNAAPNIFRPGNIVIDHNPKRNPDNRSNETVYITFTNANKVMLSRTTDQGQTFKRFQVAKAKGNPSNLFPSIDVDRAGNLYVAWIEKGSYNTYYASSTDGGETWSRKHLVNRKGASTTTMPWIVAGSRGRVAVTFYCSPVDGNPETAKFHGPWHVCVNETFKALSRHPRFSQVHATHHPIHWDSICLSGLACDTSGGDRTLLDFFQMRIDPRTGRLSVVFNESNKKPRQAEGPIAIVTAAKQKRGPSLLKGKVKKIRRRNTRKRSGDRQKDARFDFSSLNPTPPARRDYIEGLDLRSLRVKPTRVGKKHRRGLKFKLKVQNLSDAALTEALARMESQQLKFVIRWFAGFRAQYVVADWRPGQGFSFAKGGLRFTSADPTTHRLETYPQARSAKGKVRVKKKIITFKVPYRFLRDYDLGHNRRKKPSLGRARPGDKIYEVTAFTFGRPSPQSDEADYYNQADSTASFDYRLKRCAGRHCGGFFHFRRQR